MEVGILASRKSRRRRSASREPFLEARLAEDMATAFVVGIGGNVLFSIEITLADGAGLDRDDVAIELFYLGEDFREEIANFVQLVLSGGVEFDG